MKYRNLVVREYGGPEVLEVVEHELRPPAKGEARIRVLASSVSRPDVSARLLGDRRGGLGQKSYLEDLATLFGLLVDGRIEPVITARFPILQAARANALLESGGVTGNVVLVSPELEEATP